MSFQITVAHQTDNLSSFAPTSLPEPTPIPTQPAEPIPLPEKEPAILDVHPPHERVHSWRDFFIHIATITLGLFIALSLEGFIESVHHRHLLHQARENLHEEIKENQKIIAYDHHLLDSNRQHLLQVIAILRQLKADPKQPHDPILFPWGWSGPSAAAWNTARDTGALALMTYDNVQGYSLVYSQQESVQQQANIYISNQTHAGTPLIGNEAALNLTSTQIDDLIKSCSTSVTDIDLLESLMRGLDENYSSALKDL
jgi:hypothetical protein